MLYDNSDHPVLPGGPWYNSPTADLSWRPIFLGGARETAFLCYLNVVKFEENFMFYVKSLSPEASSRRMSATISLFNVPRRGESLSEILLRRQGRCVREHRLSELLHLQVHAGHAVGQPRAQSVVYLP